jgi:very-short-patch-repair endonuclease
MPLSFEQLVGMDLVQQQVAQIDKWVASIWSDTLGSHLSWRSGRGMFDSPLEATFDMWWFALQTMNAISPHVEAWPQREVEIGGSKYRVDFQMIPCYDDQKIIDDAGQMWPLIAVELDGHDYHERTKEQVTYRNQRDRALQSAGWLVLHYSGSELVRDPEACVRDVHAKAHGAFWAVIATIQAAQRAADIK